MLHYLKYGLMAIMISIALTSCSDDTGANIPTTPESGVQAQNAISILGQRTASSRSNDGDDSSESDSTYSDEICFEINFPITIIMPGGEERTVSSEDEFDRLLEDFYASADENTEEYPEIKFPISVTKEDGSLINVDNEEAFCEQLHECWGDDDWDDEDDWGDDEEEYDAECFELQYPYTVQLSDGTTITITSQEEEEAAYENHSDSLEINLQYPVTVQLADSTTQVIADEEALDALIQECYGSDYDDEEEYQECFTISYPVQIQIPGGEAVTVNDEEEEYTVIDQYYEQHPDSEEDPEYIYPITVTKADGTQVEITDDAAFEALIEECYGEEEDNDDAGDDD